MALPEPVSARDRLRQAVTLAAAIAQATIPSLPAVMGWGIAIGQRANADGPLPATPAGYAFSIWGPIFAWCLVYAIWQALPRQADDPLARRAGWLFAGAMAGDALWAAAFQAGAPVWLTAIILAAIAAMAIGALFQVEAWPGPARPGQVWFLIAPLGLLAGWVSAAAFVNLGSALSEAGLTSLRDGGGAAAPALVAAATAVALAVIARARPFPTYAIAVIWALVAILARNGGNATGITAAAAALLVTALAVRSWRQG
ncbi:hypothetical protein [Elioraea sp.]|uniref:hypothetical protein n=1 Tax=Elioraea sp. TaxID=2185103 RepID=UPI0025BAC878|nr:hypothetical protein [Elioraea sp.]